MSTQIVTEQNLLNLSDTQSMAREAAASAEVLASGLHKGVSSSAGYHAAAAIARQCEGIAERLEELERELMAARKAAA